MKGATHKAGHTLDAIFTNDPLLVYRDLLPLTWSDHKAVLFNLSRVNHHRGNPIKDPQVFTAWSKVEANKLLEQLISTMEMVPSDLEEASVWYTNWVDAAGNKLAPKKV